MHDRVIVGHVSIVYRGVNLMQHGHRGRIHHSCPPSRTPSFYPEIKNHVSLRKPDLSAPTAHGRQLLSHNLECETNPLLRPNPNKMKPLASIPKRTQSHSRTRQPSPRPHAGLSDRLANSPTPGPAGRYNNFGL